MKKITLIVSTLFLTYSMYAQWTPLTSGTTQHLTSTCFVNDTTGWVYGDIGTILKTTNGTTFTPQSSGYTGLFYSIWFIDANTGFVVGDASTIKKTINGGATWTTVTPPVSADYRKIWFLNANVGFITGGIANTSSVILKTTNGGSTWSALNTPLTQVIYGIHFTDAMNGFACDGNGHIINTTDAGATWNLQASGVAVQLISFSFTSPTNGFVVGANGTILNTTNAGATWDSIHTGTTDYFFTIHFINSTTGYATAGNVGGANDGRIYKTTNGGATWTIDATSSGRQYGGEGAFPGHNAYSCGFNGTILKIGGLPMEGIAENENSIACDVFPNPSTGKFEISVSDKAPTKTSVRVFNAIGELIYNVESANNTINMDLSTQPKGMYFAEIKTEKGKVTKKIVLTK